MSEHVASCRPDHRSLVWSCSQCGLEEDASTVLGEVDELRALTVVRNGLATVDDLIQTRRERDELRTALTTVVSCGQCHICQEHVEQFEEGSE